MVENTVLFVDDEHHILSSIRRGIEDEDFTAVFASSGEEALKIFEERHISVIVTDMRMPGMDGLTLLKAIRMKYPRTVRIVLSGYTQLSQVLATVNHGDIFQFIPKPWNMEGELLATVRRGIEHYNLAAERDKLRQGLERKNQAYQNIFRTMEQKLENEKKDLSTLKRINHSIFSLLKDSFEAGGTHSENTTVVVKGYIELIEKLQRSYFDILPGVVESKTMDNVIGDITKACAGRLIIQSTKHCDIILSGYHGFLVMACEAIVYLAAASVKEMALCVISIDSSNKEEHIVALNMGLQLIRLTADEQNRIKIGCSLLNQMGEVYDIKVLPEVISGQVVAVQVLWKACSR